MENGKRAKEPAVNKAGSLAKVKKIVGWISVLLGTILAIYIGIWRMIIRPLAALYVTYKAGQLTFLFVVATALKCWLSLTVGGLIWSVGYMIKCMLD